VLEDPNFSGRTARSPVYDNAPDDELIVSRVEYIVEEREIVRWNEVHLGRVHSRQSEGERIPGARDEVALELERAIAMQTKGELL
jgi:hypothetical protein